MLNILKEPLLHFLAAGAALFLVYELVGADDSNEERLIEVSPSTLLTFLQHRVKTYDETRVSDALNMMDDTQRGRLIDDYVNSEALYREALSLNLDKNDYVIRNRLINKLMFVIEGFGNDPADITDDQISDYFETHKARYFISPVITFTHVFFDTVPRGQAKALATAQSAVVRLNRDKVIFTDAVKHGDRFLFHTNYVDRTPDFLEDHFGLDMVKMLFDENNSVGSWIGPFKSTYGYHLVFIASRKPGRDANIENIKTRIRQDIYRLETKEQSQRAVQAIVKTYKIKIEI